MSINPQLVSRFERIGKLLELLGEDKFRVIAHQRAARAIEALTVDLASLAKDKPALLKIEGIGPKIADKIIEFAGTGRLKELDELEARVPAGVVALMDIPGVGPKTASMLWNQGGITDLAGLKASIDSGAILELPRMGAKAVEKIKASLSLAAQAGQRLRLGIAAPIADGIVARISKIPGVTRVAYAGSLRRARETIGDIDILASVENDAAAARASEVFRTMPGVTAVLLAGDTKSSIRVAIDTDFSEAEPPRDPAPVLPPDPLSPSVQCDLRILPQESWGAALMYFTGSKEHNIRLRERALKMGLTLNEYGLFPETADTKKLEAPQKRGAKAVASRTEEEVYAALGLPYTPPEMREDRGETDLTAATIPRLIELADIRAELHAHTTASDGNMSIAELALAAKARGFHTIAVTDHSKSSPLAGGLKPEALLRHIAAVREAAEKVKGIRILAGSEVDILVDGRMDYDDELLAQLDVVVASPHASLQQDTATGTRRMLKAIENPLVHIIGHPTGRLIDRRNGLDLDIGQIVAAAHQHAKALEINANWHRLDLRDIHVKAALDAGCLIAIDCDVHSMGDFDHLRYGVATGRRGWLTADRCINTWTAAKLHKWLAAKR